MTILPVFQRFLKIGAPASLVRAGSKSDGAPYTSRHAPGVHT
jgi:hypothetical protein